MRTQGSLRVVLNTKIWPGMTIERASAKSVRITAMDTDENVKVFLIMVSFSLDEAKVLFKRSILCDVCFDQNDKTSISRPIPKTLRIY